MLRAIRCIPLVLFAAALIAGCGSKGPLVLPDQPPAKKHKKAAPAPPPADQKTPSPKPADPTTAGDGSGNTDGQH
jgi:predicted small lipoprotein YifL